MVAPWAWGINYFSAYVGMMEISEDIVVFDYKEQKPEVTSVINDPISLLLIYRQGYESFFSWPIRRGWRPNVLSALNKDIINNVSKHGLISSVTKVVIIGENGAPFTNACTVRYSWGTPIIFDTEAGNGGSGLINLGRESGSRWFTAIFSISGQPEIGINWADIGAELHVLQTSGNNSLGNPNNHYYSGDYRIESNKSDRPYLAIGLMFVACGLLFVLSNILVAKAVKRSYNPVYLCLAWLGGFVSIAVPTLWVIWH